MYNLIASGSTGNCIVYHESIMVDCGVPFTKVKPYLKNINIVLLTHEHCDHLNLKTLKSMQSDRPGLRIGCGDFLLNKLEGLKNIDILNAGLLYNYINFQISPVILYHDVSNFGYRIFKGESKIIHITDTCHVEGIEAKDYDLYAIESNYNEETIIVDIIEVEQRGIFAYQKNSINSHLSEQQANDFIFKNMNENSKILRLHEHKIKI